MSARASQVRGPRVQPGDRPALRVVRRRSKALINRSAQRRLAPAAISVGICVVTMVFGVLLEQVVLAQSAFELSRIQRQMVEIEERHQALVLEATKLESPGRIERYARSRLGMVEPATVKYIVADIKRPQLGRFASSRPSRLPATGAAAALDSGYGGGAP